MQELAARLGQPGKSADAEPRRPIRLLLAILRPPWLSCRNREAGDRITATGRLINVTRRGEMELVTFQVSSRDERDSPVSEATALFIIRKP